MFGVLVAALRRYVANGDATFLKDFLVILKRMLQNYQKTVKKCFFVADNNVWIIIKECVAFVIPSL